MPIKQKPFEVKITERQLEAIVGAVNDLQSMIGVGEQCDEDWKKIVKNIDAFLKANGYKRNFN